MTHRAPILPPEEPPASGWRETLWFLAATAAASMIGLAVAKLEYLWT